MVCAHVGGLEVQDIAKKLTRTVSMRPDCRATRPVLNDVQAASLMPDRADGKKPKQNGFLQPGDMLLFLMEC
jgi:hypothetical protein